MFPPISCRILEVSWIFMQLFISCACILFRYFCRKLIIKFKCVQKSIAYMTVLTFPIWCGWKYNGISPMEGTRQWIIKVWDNNSRTCFEWFTKFKNCDFELKDKECTGKKIKIWSISGIFSGRFPFGKYAGKIE